MVADSTYFVTCCVYQVFRNSPKSMVNDDTLQHEQSKQVTCLNPHHSELCVFVLQYFKWVLNYLHTFVYNVHLMLYAYYYYYYY